MPKRIYIVDDDSIFLLISSRLIKKLYPAMMVETFKNGELAIEGLQHGQPDILFLDLNMPIMDGWIFLDKMQETYAHPPFDLYISSSSINPQDKQRAHDNPFVKGFIEKPWDSEDLERILE